MEARSTDFAGSVSGTVWNSEPVGDSWQSTALYEWPGSQKQTWKFATGNPLLVGKHYTCARAAMAIYNPFGGSGWGTDYVDRETLELKPAVVTAQSAKWLSPKDGQTVSGKLTERGVGAQNCEVKVSGPVARTENYVDGTLNDTQVYSPWSCEWDTRNYVNGAHLPTVKAYNAAHNVIATDTIRVTVNNPKPPPVNNPPPPAIETSPAVVTPSPSGSTGPQPAPRFTRQKARKSVKTALALRYGNAFRQRKGYVAKCQKMSASRWSCPVRWRYGPFIYKGKIKLTLRSDGRVASQFVLRKTLW